jgi:hypothetical protein
LSIRIDPLQTWGWLLDDAWRQFRAHFYDPKLLRALNWEEKHAQYVALLPRVASRDEFDVLLHELLTEARSSHVDEWDVSAPLLSRVPFGVMLQQVRFPWSLGFVRTRTSTLPNQSSVYTHCHACHAHARYSYLSLSLSFSLSLSLSLVLKRAGVGCGGAARAPVRSGQG